MVEWELGEEFEDVHYKCPSSANVIVGESSYLSEFLPMSIMTKMSGIWGKSSLRMTSELKFSNFVKLQ